MRKPSGMKNLNKGKWKRVNILPLDKKVKNTNLMKMKILIKMR